MLLFVIYIFDSFFVTKLKIIRSRREKQVHVCIFTVLGVWISMLMHCCLCGLYIASA